MLIWLPSSPLTEPISPLHQVHTFYEAVGYMISAQTDQVIQDHLIGKYMMLPNQVWDEIINQASRVSYCTSEEVVVALL